MAGSRKKKYNVGLVLSGGGARGFAHVGVMKALNEAGIYPDVISGVSAGAMAGVLYADGSTPDEMMKMFSDTKFFKYLEFSLPRRNLLKMTKLTKIIAANLKAKKFEDLKIPLFVAATDLNNGRCEYFSKGELLKIVIASATVPVLFPPMLISEKNYVDGGVLNNFPFEPIANKCNLLIGVNVNPIGYRDEFKSLMSIAERSFHLCFAASMLRKIKKCHIYIEPEKLRKYKLLDISKNKEIYKIGYDAAREKLKENTLLVKKYSCV
ncbi:MAG: patatin-like phospholipase family protein [Bacteroidota bacterium]